MESRFSLFLSLSLSSSFSNLPHFDSPFIKRLTVGSSKILLKKKKEKKKKEKMDSIFILFLLLSSFRCG